jgi:predicted dehydrogenase
MNSFRWGILGTGGIAQAFAKDLAYLDDHVVAAVGSRTIASAAKFASAFPGCVSYGSYDELVNADVDAIYVASPHPMHEEHAMLAMRAGKPVLCEKAFTINQRQARQLTDYSHAHNVALMEAMWTRFLPHIAQIKEIIAAGTLGEIHTVIADHGQYIPYERAARLWEPELGGGALLDLGIYSLTIAHLVLGNPSQIQAQATLTEKKVDLQTSMILTYPSGAHALLSCTMAVRSSVSAVIAGEKARIEIDGSFYAPTAFRVITRDGEVTKYPKNYQGGGLREEAREFARVVQSGEIESPLMPHATSLELMRQMDEIRRQIGVKYPGE